MSKIIGIDLGTSTSEAAVMQDGQPIIIPYDGSKLILPSAVGIRNGRFVVGEEATSDYLLHPSDTAIEIKRMMGEDKQVTLDGKTYTPVELSAKLLQYIRQYAEEYLEETIEDAVITVPAYFNNLQRKETLEAGALAGLKIRRIINEPTAAALCYGIEHLEEESHILVYDFGGGTFDVTLLELFDGILDVKASSGNNRLGGKDFDQRLIDYFMKQIQLKYHTDVSSDLYAMVKLKEEAVRCKIALSESAEYEVNLPMLGESKRIPFSYKETITKMQFENMIQDLVELTKDPISSVLQDSKLLSHDIDVVLLVGGSTRIPLIKNYVSDLLGQEPKELINPDLSVALGAAVQAGILNDDISSDSGILITDVSAHSLGVSVMKNTHGFPVPDMFDVLIPRNTTLPSSQTCQYSTSTDYQTQALIEVYQGEHFIASSNYFLGEFAISNIPKAKMGKEKIEVTFSYDLNGILDVSATIVSTGKKAGITVDIAASDENYVDPDTWEEAANAKQYRALIHRAERRLKKLILNNDSSLICEELESAITDLKKGIVSGLSEDMMDALEEDLIFILEED